MFTTAFYNVGNPRYAVCIDDICTILTEKRPHLLFTSEFADRKDEGETVDRKMDNYRYVRRSETPGAVRIGLFIHKSVDVDKIWSKQISETTPVGRTVPGAKRDGTAEAKSIVAISHSVNGRSRVDGGIHLVPGAGHDARAKALHHLQVEKCTLWVDRKRRPASLLGDWNATPTSELMDYAREHARLVIPRTPTHGDRTIDYGLVNEQQTKVISRQTMKLHSDHRAILFGFED